MQTMYDPETEDRLAWQSSLLVWTFALFTVIELCVVLASEFLSDTTTAVPTLGMLVFSAVFVGIVLLARAATVPAALLGGGFCLLLVITTCSDPSDGASLWHSGLPALVALFVLTFAATRWRRGKKQAMGLAEGKRGRAASQVAANLAVACTVPSLLLYVTRPPYWGDPIARTIALAALAEATADTLSSEIGQAIGGRTILLTNLRAIDVGIDGGISLGGTMAGILGAAAIAAVGMLTIPLDPKLALTAFGAAVFGLFFDSFLGATAEHRGWMNNDLVNFTSTLVAGAIAGIVAWQF